MNSSLLSILTLPMAASPVLLLLVNIFIKSTVVLLMYVVLRTILQRRLHQSSLHLLCLHGFFCLALLPLFPNLTGGLLSEEVNAQSLFELTVVAGANTSAMKVNWDMWSLMVYLIPCVLLTGRLVLGLRSLVAIRANSRSVDDSNLLTRFETIRKQLGISRQVVLRSSDAVHSPISFGLFVPQVVVPAQTALWSSDVIDDVFMHELNHIKRLDWLSMLFGYVMASLYWMNPLSWYLLKKLNEDTENACDEAVVQAGRSGGDYAQSLVSVARSCRHHEHGARMLAQTMLDRSTLESRINYLLEEKIMKTIDVRKDLRKAAVMLVLATAGLLVAVSSTQVVSAQNAADQEMLPLKSGVPMYPTKAAEQGIVGWVQVRFSVMENGLIDTDSAEVVDSQPSDIFNANALRALADFRFEPRVVNGQAVSVPNVQYVFRFALTENSEPRADQPATRN